MNARLSRSRWDRPAHRPTSAAATLALAIACSTGAAGVTQAAVFSDRADVTRARKVTPPPTEKRCWTEWEQNAAETAMPGAPSVSQTSGFGAFKYVAAGGGYSNPPSAESAAQAASKPVEHCIDEPGAAKPAYWEVEYTYRGIPFTTRLNYDPGPQITVRVVVDPQP